MNVITKKKKKKGGGAGSMDGGFVTAAQRLCKYSVVGSHYPHQLPQKLTRRSDQAAEAPKKKKKKNQ